MIQGSNWMGATAGDHLAHVMSVPRAARAALAKGYDWAQFPETVLGWIMAQKGVDLDTALAAFFKGGPERFNYIPKRDVPAEYHGICRLLDNICLRINSGFYLVHRDAMPSAHAQLRLWLDVQEADRREHNAGRWVFDEDIVEALLQVSAHTAQEIEFCSHAGPAPRTALVWIKSLLRKG